MNVLSCSINTLNVLYDLSGVEVGQHFYWKIGGFQVHGQVLITSWVVIAILLGSAALAIRNPQGELMLVGYFGLTLLHTQKEGSYV